MIGDYHELGNRARIVPQYNPDPFFMTAYGPVLTQGYAPIRSVAATGESQSACGGSCSVRRPATVTRQPLPEQQSNRPVPVRFLKTLGRLLAGI